MTTITVIIETPKGSNVKFAYDTDSRFFKLKKKLPLGMVFPFDFGFIPGTKGEDGDPLDILVLSEFASFPGCQLDCRLIGGMQAVQTEKNRNGKIRNDRFFAVAEESLIFKDVRSMKDMPADILKQMEAFFIQYNKLEGKKFKVTGTSNKARSIKFIRDKK